MPYADPELARVKAKERSRKWREAHRPAGWIDTRGRHGNHRKGSKHPRWNVARILSSHGYVKVRVGGEHRLADPNGYAYEHLLVWVSAGNKVLLSGEILHHKNSDQTDNRLANLELLLSRPAHNRYHLKDMERDTVNGRFVGKHAAGALLDGREWREMPSARGN